MEGDALSVEEPFAKLNLVAQTVREVWDSTGAESYSGPDLSGQLTSPFKAQ